VRTQRKGSADPAAPVAAYRLAEPLPALAVDRLSLVAKRGSGVIASLPESVRLLREAAASEPGLKPALSLADQFLPLLEQVHAEMERYQDVVGDVPPEAFEVAKRYCLLFTAAACLGLWVHTHQDAESGATGALWHDALWLRASLSRLLTRLGLPEAADTEAYDEVLQQAVALRDGGRLVSLLPFALHEPAAVTEPQPATPERRTAAVAQHPTTAVEAIAALDILVEEAS
jgi:hypothetical protein